MPDRVYRDRRIAHDLECGSRRTGDSRSREERSSAGRFRQGEGVRRICRRGDRCPLHPLLVIRFIRKNKKAFPSVAAGTLFFSLKSAPRRERMAFEKIMQAGGYTSIRTGQAQDANAILIPKDDADEAMDCASCIGCGACVAACKNGSAMLFVSSKVSQFALLPQGRVEAARRAKAMVAKMDELGFGNCTNTRACEAVCPKCETIANIARLNREFIRHTRT